MNWSHYCNACKHMTYGTLNETCGPFLNSLYPPNFHDQFCPICFPEAWDWMLEWYSERNHQLVWEAKKELR